MGGKSLGRPWVIEMGSVGADRLRFFSEDIVEVDWW